MNPISLFDLPDRFNMDMFPVHINTHDVISPIYSEYAPNRFEISQYLLEYDLHEKIKQYGTGDSDIVFLPVYSFLLAWKKAFFYDVTLIVDRLMELNSIIDDLSKTKKILIPYSDVMWEDFRCFINHIPYNKNVFFICYESVGPNQIPVPFLTHIRQDPKKYTIPVNQKQFLISYAGRDRPELSAFSDLNRLDLSRYHTPNQWISYNRKEIYDGIDSLYASSVFSLQPHGDKQTRRGFYHSLLMGCVPVVFRNNYKAYESVFSGYVNIEDICVVVDNENIEAQLESKLPSVSRMLEKIDSIKHLLLYSDDSILGFIVSRLS